MRKSLSPFQQQPTCRELLHEPFRSFGGWLPAPRREWIDRGQKEQTCDTTPKEDTGGEETQRTSEGDTVLHIERRK
jgi:hypothetical protein